MKQYWEIKALYPEEILLFRMGDFFEMFFEDAVRAAPVVGIALTQRNKKSADETPMCGVPHHSVAQPINKLLRAGFKVAICDQLEDPKFAKGIVKRGVTRVLTPGMVYDVDTLDATRNNFIAAYDENSVAFVDTSTGDAFYFLIEDRTKVSEKVKSLILRFPVVEIVRGPQQESLGLNGRVESLHEFRSHEGGLPASAQRLLSYYQKLNNGSAPRLKDFEKRSFKGRMRLNEKTLRHLEVFESYAGNENGSLYSAINRTQTSAGSRLLRNYLMFPLTELSEIKARQSEIQKWIEDLPKLKKVRELFSSVGDMERRLAKVAAPSANARDLASLAQSLKSGLAALDFSGALHKISKSDVLSAWVAKIEDSYLDELPLSTKQGHLFKKGVSKTLDEWIELSTNSSQLIADLEAREKAATQISSLKVRYNNVFGYYIEITHLHREKVPTHYMRKQTLANAERYCTDELIELEKKVLSAQSRRAEIESELFEQDRKQILSLSAEVLFCSQIIAEIDVLSSFASLARERNYTKPQFSENHLGLKASRHPVVEQILKNKFVPNEISLDFGASLLLTGPNMAGKSTLMRQVALIAILAQVGSYVPCEHAVLPIYDSLYTRIGASDQLTEGLSTFMVEMTETAEIIQEAGAKSLLILDEIGRGTSTFDGLSLAQALLEHLLDHKIGMTFFATHYHELTMLSQNYPQLLNGHMAIRETNGEIRFLHTLKMGAALRSYGIQVAQLAGLPPSITTRARELLKRFEKKDGLGHVTQAQMSLLDFVQEVPQANAAAEIPAAQKMVLEDLQKFSVLQTAPLAALQKISEWQEQLKES